MFNNEKIAGAALASGGDASSLLTDGVKNYFDKFKKATGAAYIKKTSCPAVLATTDGNYYGSYPGGYVEAKDYKSSGDLDGKTDAQSITLIAGRIVTGEDDVTTAYADITLPT